MNQKKTGDLIRSLRKERGLTQQQLACRMSISDKTVSKWERGAGSPDLSMFPLLSELFGVEIDVLLSGELNSNDQTGGNMKRTVFYVCPDCGNIFTASVEAGITCCGKKLTPLQAKNAAEEDRLSVEQVGDEYYISSDHEMTREHYISFVALAAGDTVILRRLYPEWSLKTYLPRIARGNLLWYCTQHGLFHRKL